MHIFLLNIWACLQMQQGRTATGCQQSGQQVILWTASIGSRQGQRSYTPDGALTNLQAGLAKTACW
jgi:hypothetical protein